MAQRWQLAQANNLLDVGCGLGHWHRVLLPFLNPQAQIFGVDREQQWVNNVISEIAKRYPDIDQKRFHYQQGDAYKLPYDDNSFDAVTCQTLIIHLEYPEAGLKEMVRVAKPGGLIICVEPENLRNCLDLDCLSPELPIEWQVMNIEFWMRWERGKMALGEGNCSLGGLVPGYLSKFGLSDIAVYVTDKASFLCPPYEDTEQQAMIADMIDSYRDSAGYWDISTSKRYFCAGGGTEERFNELWTIVRSMHEKRIAAVAEYKYVAGNGSSAYLISGRKPLS